MPRRDAPVGVFDSGVGGLTILSELLRELPGERFVYFGDTGNCPYGVRPQREIQELSAAAARFLLSHGAKIIVVACNTASVSALAFLRANFTNEFVGVVPAVKPAAARTRSGKVGVAATEASANGTYLKQLIEQFAHGVEVFAVGCPRLVELAEAGKLDGAETEAAVRGYLAPMLAAGIDELVLGCTHFPAQRAVFARVAGPGVEILDSGAAIARRTRFVLERDGLLAGSPDEPGHAPARAPRPLGARDEMWCSGEDARCEPVAAAILGMPVTVRHAPGMLWSERAGQLAASEQHA
ncbi:MAG TPA: glutamate racemase [Ktedonobacterales bacterium]|jgi:glutamate racemase